MQVSVSFVVSTGFVVVGLVVVAGFVVVGLVVVTGSVVVEDFSFVVFSAFVVWVVDVAALVLEVVLSGK